jgi:hypothetical protein
MPSLPAETNSSTPIEDSVRFDLRQKRAEIRRRTGYIQKLGHKKRFNYSYVIAADFAGSVGDIVAELRMARAVMAYTFSDVESGEEIVAKVAGHGLDAGDKAPCKE